MPLAHLSNIVIFQETLGCELTDEGYIKTDPIQRLVFMEFMHVVTTQHVYVLSQMPLQWVQQQE